MHVRKVLHVYDKQKYSQVVVREEEGMYTQFKIDYSTTSNIY